MLNTTNFGRVELELKTRNMDSKMNANNCLFDYLSKHIQSIIPIAPRREALETPIKVEKEKYESYRYRWNSKDEHVREPYQATRTTIKSVDNNNG